MIMVGVSGAHRLERGVGCVSRKLIIKPEHLDCSFVAANIRGYGHSLLLPVARSVRFCDTKTISSEFLVTPSTVTVIVSSLFVDRVLPVLQPHSPRMFKKSVILFNCVLRDAPNFGFIRKREVNHAVGE